MQTISQIFKSLLRPFFGSFCLAGAFLLMSYSAMGQDIYVYAASDQSDEQLAEDRYACHRWAVEESDFDPSQFDEVTPLRTVKVPVPRNEAEDATEKGMLAGTVAGGIIGAHDSNVGKGAVIGAVVGTLVGAAIEDTGRQEARQKARSEAQREADEIAQTKAQLALRKSNYRRALTACLEGRGYTVR